MAVDEELLNRVTWKIANPLVAWMDCEIQHSLRLGTHTLFVGEIMAAQISADEARAATTQDTRMKCGAVTRH